MKTPS